MGNSGIGGIQILGARTLSIEAIQELQITPAPFDVRYGNFAAGLINAVTKSGTNRWEGSLSGYYSERGLVGRDALGNRVDDFVNKELTATLGGPIVRDRAAFFLDAGLQNHVFPENYPVFDRDPDGLRSASPRPRPSAFATSSGTPTTSNPAGSALTRFGFPRETRWARCRSSSG